MKLKPTAAATVLLLAVFAVSVGEGSSPASAAGATYYVSAAGNDANSGTSPGAAWKSLTKVSAAVLSPGDSVSFRRGDTWTGGVIVNSSGTAGSAITLNAYGAGERPTITGGKSGNCVRLNGSYVTVDNLRAVACGYSGFNVYGDGAIVQNSVAANNAAGIKVGNGSDFGRYVNNTLTDNNIMNVNTPGTSCGTPQALKCSDDSGAFGVLINGNDNEFAGNTVTGSTAASLDFVRDGSAFEIYNGSRNRIHHNTALDNNVFSELGRSTGTTDGNTFSYNLIRSSCGANCAQAKGLIARGSNTSFGPTTSTTFEYNTVWLNGPQSKAVVCHASCPASTVIRGNILVGARNSLWMDATGWTEQQNVLNGPANIIPNASSTTAPAGFVAAPQDLHLAAGSPAIDRAGTSPFPFDLAGQPAILDGDCNGTTAADAGVYEYNSPDC